MHTLEKTFFNKISLVLLNPRIHQINYANKAVITTS